MATLGNWLEFVGTIVTLGGLVFVLIRASNALTRLRSTLRQLPASIRRLLTDDVSAHRPAKIMSVSGCVNATSSAEGEAGYADVD